MSWSGFPSRRRMSHIFYGSSPLGKASTSTVWFPVEWKMRRYHSSQHSMETDLKVPSFNFLVVLERKSSDPSKETCRLQKWNRSNSSHVIRGSISLFLFMLLSSSPQIAVEIVVDENRHFRLSLENEKSDFNSVNDMFHCSVSSFVPKQLKN